LPQEIQDWSGASELSVSSISEKSSRRSKLGDIVKQTIDPIRGAVALITMPPSLLARADEVIE
jgi:hypothetical protein